MKASFFFGFGSLLGLAFAPGMVLAQSNMSIPALPNISPENVGKCMRLVKKDAIVREVPLNPVMTYEGHTEYKSVSPELVPGKYNYTAVEGYTYAVPQFKTVTEQVITSPGYNKLVAIEGKMETTTKTVVIRPPSLVWKKGANLSSVSAKDPNSGDVYCLVEDRGLVKNIPVTKVAKPYSFRIDTVAPSTEMITRQVIDKNAPMIIKSVAPVNASKDVLLLKNPAAASNEALIQQASVWVNGAQEPVTFQQIDVPAGYAWEFIDCNGVQSGQVSSQAMSSNVVKSVEPQGVEVKFPATTSVVISKKQLQTRLRDLGLYNGPIDGIIGAKTKAAIASFQGQNNLPVTGQADTKTLKSLGF